MRQGLLSVCLLLLFFCQRVVALETVTIGIITDNADQHSLIPISLIQEEIKTLTSGEFDVLMPAQFRAHGDGTLTGIRHALTQQLASAEIDLIITLGVVASQQAAQIPELNKPVIAAMVLDRKLQAMPYQDGSSGKHNFAYIATEKNIPSEIKTFKELAGFKHLTVLVNPFWLATIPDLKQTIAALEKDNQITIHLVPAEKSLSATLEAIPGNTDAVYVAPISAYSEAQMQELAKQLIAKKLPSFSSLGAQDVAIGILAAMGGTPEDKVRFARRIALDVQSILLGDEAGSLNVLFDENTKLIINMQTARAIGFSPPWRFLLEAHLLHQEDTQVRETLTLLNAMQTAIHANLELQVNELFVAVAQENVDIARAALLPQLVAGVTNQQVDVNDPLAVIGIAQNMTTAEFGAQQSIYSDDFWANFRISQYLEDAEDYKFYGEMLDTLADTGVAYLNVLRASAIKEVRRANLDVTEVNLDLAQMRERVGYSSRADVLRWESQLASDQQALLEAQALELQMQTALNRWLNLPQKDKFNMDDAALGQFIAIIDEQTLDPFIGNPYSWQVFQQFAVEETLANAPELGEITSLTYAKEREQLANRRAFFIPDFDIEGGLQQVITKEGVGSDFGAEGISDTQWQVSVNATLPLLTGGARQAQLAQTGFEVTQLELQNAATQELLEQRTRDILYQMGESYPAITLSAQAAKSAQENLDLVTDRYAHGSVDITDLIDAQNNTLSAQLDNAQARYVFLMDFIALLRSTGDLTVALGENSLAQWFARVEHFYEEEMGS